MKVSKAVRAARKTAQTARLARKEDEDYPSFYANQPFQREKAKRNEEVRIVRFKVREAEEEVAVARVSGENLTSAEEKLKAAQRHLDDIRPKGRSLTVELTGAAE